MPKVVVYSTAFCPYCVRAKMLLEHKGVEYEEIRVDQDRDQMMIMIQRSQRRKQQGGENQEAGVLFHRDLSIRAGSHGSVAHLYRAGRVLVQDRAT